MATLESVRIWFSGKPGTAFLRRPDGSTLVAKFDRDGITMPGVSAAAMSGDAQIPWEILSDGWEPWQVFHGLDAVIGDIMSKRATSYVGALKYVPTESGKDEHCVYSRPGRGIHIIVCADKDGEFVRVY
jgi:hypothetical protein